jgi:hypothetical protein
MSALVFAAGVDLCLLWYQAVLGGHVMMRCAMGVAGGAAIRQASTEEEDVRLLLCTVVRARQPV